MAMKILRRYFKNDQGICLQFSFIVIINVQLVRHKEICLTVNINVYIILSNEVIYIDYIKLNDNITDPLTRWLVESKLKNH